jgi:hypothetical protein
MTRPNGHLVQRQIIELAIAGAAGPDAQRELARPFWDRAVPELEKVFDRAAGPDERLRLDRLELNLGRIGGADWTTEFCRKLVAELERTLAQFTAAPVGRDGKAGREPAPAEAREQFLFFLVHGRLPWWARTPSGRVAEAVFDESDTAGWSRLRDTVFADRGACVRLVHSVADEFLDRAVRRWSGLLHTARVLEQLTPPRLRGDARYRWRRMFWMLVLDRVAANAFHSPRGGPQLLRDLLTLRHTYDSDGEPRPPLPPSPSDDDEQGRRSRSASGEQLPNPWREWQAFLDDGEAAEPDAAEIRADAGTLIGRAPQVSRLAAGPAPDRKRRPVEEDAIYLGGAGAVLLHPFLETLFRERGVLTGRNFRDAEARDRAVHLLGLLTFGRVDVPEYDLLLPKLLCGLRFDEPLEPASLEDDDMAACDGLLHAVLEHWTALRSSSPDWLRQQFFLREGKLEQVDSGFRLTVERRAQDVLLARLPWGCSVIALPWVSERIFVRWLE